MNMTSPFGKTTIALSPKMFAVLIVLLGCLNSFAQDKKQSSTNSDTAAVMSLLTTGDRFKTTMPDTAMIYYEQARQLAQTLHWDAGTSQYIRHAIFVLNNQGKYQQALALCQQGLRIASASGNKKDLAIAYNNVANEYQYFGELSLAADNYLKAAQLAEAMHELSFLKVFDNNLSSIFFELEQYDKSYAYAKASWEIAQQLHDTAGIANSLVNVGVSEIHLGQSTQALEHFRQVLLLNQKLDDYTLSCDCYTNIGSIEMNAHHIDEAEKNYKELLQIATKNDNPNYKVFGLAGLADVYMARKDWSKAKPLVQNALAISTSIGDRNQLVQLYEKAATIHENLNDWKTALDYRHQFEKLNDSLLNDKTRNHINELETRYQGAKKDQQLAEEHLKLAKSQSLVHTKNIQLFASIAGLVMLVILLILGQRLLRQRQKVNLLRAELKGQEGERKRVAQEMHDDLGSGLTTVLYLAQSLADGTAAEEETVSKKIVATTTSLVETMNEIVWSMNQRYNSLEDLVSYIRHQSSLWMDRPGLNYEIDIAESIPAINLNGELRRNIYLVVKEAFHNVLKHSGANNVKLQMDFSKEIFIAVSDNGAGFRTNGSRWGNGLNNMQERMKSIGGKLEVKSDQGTTIALHVPL